MNKPDAFQIMADERDQLRAQHAALRIALRAMVDAYWDGGAGEDDQPSPIADAKATLAECVIPGVAYEGDGT